MAKKLFASSPHVGLRNMKSADMKRKPWSDKELAGYLRAADRQAAGDDSGINFEDIPPLTEQQLSQMVRFRDLKRKIPVSVRLDPEVLDWLKSKGEGHLTRINDILHNIMDAEQRVRRP